MSSKIQEYFEKWKKEQSIFGKIFDISIVGLLILTFVALILVFQAQTTQISIENFAPTWLIAYLFVVTLGMRLRYFELLKIESDIEMRVLLEWAFLCAMGIVLFSLFWYFHYVFL